MDKGFIEQEIIRVLKTVYDPEIPVDVYELGLIYEIHMDDDINVKIVMTLTSPACPVAESLPGDVKRKIESIPQVKSAEIELVWEPTWNQDMMSEEAKLVLGFI